MKIGIDTFTCEGGKSAVGAYLLQLLKRIPPSGGLYELFGWEFDRFAYKEAAPRFEFISQCSINGRLANFSWHLFQYPKFAKKRAYNACFFPAAHKRLPNNSPCPTIGTVHDMAAYWGIREKKEPFGSIIRFVFPNILRQMEKIIAVSNFVKQELIDIAKVKESRIEVVPDGIDTTVFYPRPKNGDSVVLIQPFSFRQPYILYTSRIQYPIKNHIKLIEAFDIFKARTHYPHKLILAGGDSYGAEKVRASAASSAYKTDIFFPGHFPSKNLPELYAGADMVVIPSRYEGFGMGVLEAMASGVPVACARAASLPETAEHAALYFDPNDAEDMADRITTLATNHDVYHNCRSLGLERVKSYSWEQCTNRTLDIIQAAAEK
ncbi:MAG: glycosyltransferase family 4 protein [Treponema sp.]|jgi:glycosyltransferase involved in cell wall biosynthesis|nr:glycosyltransferase family 4 protein [Treponema sp.]